MNGRREHKAGIVCPVCRQQVGVTPSGTYAARLDRHGTLSLGECGGSRKFVSTPKGRRMLSRSAH